MHHQPALASSLCTPALRPLEIASGIVVEPLKVAKLGRPARGGPHPRTVLEALVLPALTEGRAAVSFSGGRDSSLILAVATLVARREGLADPVPITMTHHSPSSQEREWQELVVRHLGIQDWETVDVADTMEAMGDDAIGFVRDCGIHLPPNAYLHLPVLRRAPSRTVLTGIGGDEILGTPAHRLMRVHAGLSRPRPRDLLSLGLAGAPAGVRRRWKGRGPFPWCPWLTPAAASEVRDGVAADVTRSRVRWDVATRYVARSRTFALGRQAMDALAAREAKVISSPLASSTFAEALAGYVGMVGPVDRSSAMRLLAADLLPAAVHDRPDKADFDGLLWGSRFRRFADAWEPAHLRELPEVITSLVDGDRLKAEWSEESPSFGSLALAQLVALTRQDPAPAIDSTRSQTRSVSDQDLRR